MSVAGVEVQCFVQCRSALHRSCFVFVIGLLHNSKEVLFIARSRQCKNVEVHCTSAVLLAPRMTISVDAVKCFVIRRI